jgi:hypothetical protein
MEWSSESVRAVISTKAKEAGMLILNILIVVGRAAGILLISMAKFIMREVRSGGKDKAIAIGKFLLALSIALVSKLGQLLLMLGRFIYKMTKKLRTDNQKVKTEDEGELLKGWTKTSFIKSTAYILIQRFALLIVAAMNKVQAATKDDISDNAHTSEMSQEDLIDTNESLYQNIIKDLRHEGIDVEEAEEEDILKIERPPYYSYNFSMTPRVVTNRGTIRIKNMNINFIQLIQRN